MYVRILHQGVGGISKSDVQLANASGGVVFGFNVRANKQAMELSETEGVDIRYYSVIYDLAEDIKGLVIGLMKPEKRESFLGNAEIREVFRVSKLGNVAGCFVVDGSVKRGAGVRLIRDDVVIHEETLKTSKERLFEINKQIHEAISNKTTKVEEEEVVYKTSLQRV